MKQKSFWVSILNAVLVVATIAVNALAVLLPLNGKDTGALSDQYPNLFVPAGITFSIWSVIFVLWVVYVIYHIIVALNDQRRAEKYIPSQVAFALSCLLNMGWLFTWHYELLGLSVIVMLALLVTLLFIFVFQRKQEVYGQIGLAAVLPIDVYAGWITVATIANITALLVSLGWNGWGISQDVWAMFMIAVGAVVGIIVLLRYQAIAYAAVIVWAYLGIIIKRSASEPVYHNIIWTSWIAIGILVIFMIQSVFVMVLGRKMRKG
ncbi:tryptophan-rich sensory protein [Thermospira aquatica]|uniref:Tryptophan-rich sensory protein n=1 Tax=Thermospira aquatica TaxID=2828656 RepID=A0AAX3BC56_9SPIR|nr:tryptophan-rich sensory protein [Thermospira aquatica]URA09564.1 tryptophan-rich sensory protein [Thermospira aquatica]